MHRNHISIIFILLSGILGSCNDTPQQNTNETPTATAGNIPPPAILQFNVLNVYPHDTLSYTQGFIIHDGQLLEATGGNPSYNPAYKSGLGKVDLKTGKINQKVPLDSSYFGEGITVFNYKLVPCDTFFLFGFYLDEVVGIERKKEKNWHRKEIKCSTNDKVVESLLLKLEDDENNGSIYSLYICFVIIHDQFRYGQN